MGIFTGLENDLLGVLELVGGGVGAFMGAIYLAEGAASGSTIGVAIPAAVLMGSSVLLADSLVKTGIWNWQKDFNINWTDFLYGYVLGGAEVLSGAYLAYLAFNDINAGATQYTYKGVAYGAGVLFGAAGAYLLYDGYFNRIAPIIAGEHITSFETTTYRETDDKYQALPTYNVYRFTYTDPQTDKPDYIKGSEYEKRCASLNTATWLTLEKQCAETKSYEVYRAEKKKLDEAEHVGPDDFRRCGDQTNDGTNRPVRAPPGATVCLRDVFHKPIKDLTSSEWISVNATKDDAPDSVKDDYFSRNPKDCQIAKLGGRNTDFTPNLKQDHYIVSTGATIKDWSWLQWLFYQTGGKDATSGVGANEERNLHPTNYNATRIDANDIGQTFLINRRYPGGHGAASADVNKTLAQLGYNEEQEAERVGIPDLADESPSDDSDVLLFDTGKDTASNSGSAVPRPGQRGKRDVYASFPGDMSRYASGSRPPKVVTSVTSK